LVLLLCVLLCHGNVQHHEAEHEGVEKFAETSMEAIETLGWCQVEGIVEDCCIAESSCHACDALHDTVDAYCCPVKAWTSQGLGDAQTH